MALKKSSEVIRIGFSITESAADTFTRSRVDLQLNPLDQEVFVIVAADLDPAAPNLIDGLNTQVAMSVSATSKTAFTNLNDSDCIANAVLDLRVSATPGSGVGFTRTSLDSPQGDTPYISIVATNDFFVQLQGTNNGAAKNGFGALWGYRAKADAATYAALVQSEVLSS